MTTCYYIMVRVFIKGADFLKNQLLWYFGMMATEDIQLVLYRMTLAVRGSLIVTPCLTLYCAKNAMPLVLA